MRWGLRMLAFLPLLSFVNFFWQNAPTENREHSNLFSRFVANPSDDWAIHSEAMFRGARDYLPPRGSVGFVSDTEDGLFLVRYYGAQHTLTPRIVRPDAKATFVLCLFYDAKRLQEARQNRQLWRWTELDTLRRKYENGLYSPVARIVKSPTPLVLVRDFGNGSMLFRNDFVRK